jgi:hypothetical protein
VGAVPGRAEDSERFGVSTVLHLRDIRGVLVVNPDYHRKQADTLNRLAAATRDPDTAAALRLLAAEHLALARAEAEAREQDRRK